MFNNETIDYMSPISQDCSRSHKKDYTDSTESCLLSPLSGTQTLTSWISVSLAAMSYATHLTVVQDMVDLTPRWMMPDMT